MGINITENLFKDNNQSLTDEKSKNHDLLDSILGQNPLSSENSDDGGGIGGFDPGAIKNMLHQMIEELIKEIKAAEKSGKPKDFSMEISQIMGKMSAFGSEQVGASSAIMGVGTNRKDALSYINELIGNNSQIFKDGKVNPNAMVEDINPYTGKKIPGTKVPAEKALVDQITYLTNNPMSKYILDKNGKSTGKKNPAYVFFHNANNYQAYVNQVNSLKDLLSHLKSPGLDKAPSIPLPPGFPPSSFSDLQKFDLPPIKKKDFYPPFDPKDVPSAKSHLPPANSWNLHYGSIAYLQFLANPNADMYNPSKTPGLVSDTFKKMYIAKYGQAAFDNLRIPPGLNGGLRQFLDASGDANALNQVKHYQTIAAQDLQSLKKLNAEKDSCNEHIGSCTLDQYDAILDSITRVSADKKTAEHYQAYWQQKVDSSLNVNPKDMEKFIEDVHNGSTPIEGGDGHPATPDSSALNALTTSLQELSGQCDTVTNTMSTFLKQQMTNLQAATTMEKNTLQGMSKQMDAMIKGQTV